MLKVSRDEAGNRLFSVYGGGVKIVQLNQGARFRVEVGKTSLEIPPDATELAWSRGCGRIEFALRNVSLAGRGRIPAWLVRFKKNENYGDWSIQQKPEIGVWLCVVIPVNPDNDPWLLKSCALPDDELTLARTFGEEFWKDSVVEEIRRDAAKQRRPLKEILLSPLMLLLLALLVLALPFAVASVVLFAGIALLVLVIVGLFTFVWAAWQLVSGAKWRR